MENMHSTSTDNALLAKTTITNFICCAEAFKCKFEKNHQIQRYAPKMYNTNKKKLYTYKMTK